MEGMARGSSGTDSNNLAGEAASGHPLSPPSEGGERILGTVAGRGGYEEWAGPPSPSAVLKPIGDGVRSMPPFGLPKREGQHEQTIEAKHRRRRA